MSTSSPDEEFLTKIEKKFTIECIPKNATFSISKDVKPLSKTERVRILPLQLHTQENQDLCEEIFDSCSGFSFDGTTSYQKTNVCSFVLKGWKKKLYDKRNKIYTDQIVSEKEKNYTKTSVNFGVERKCMDLDSFAFKIIELTRQSETIYFFSRINEYLDVEYCFFKCNDNFEFTKTNIVNHFKSFFKLELIRNFSL